MKAPIPQGTASRVRSFGDTCRQFIPDWFHLEYFQCEVSGFSNPAACRFVKRKSVFPICCGGRRSAAASCLEHFAFEKGKMRGGGTAPPDPKWAEKPRFFRETTGRMVWNAKRFKRKMLWSPGEVQDSGEGATIAPCSRMAEGLYEGREVLVTGKSRPDGPDSCRSGEDRQRQACSW